MASRRIAGEKAPTADDPVTARAGSSTAPAVPTHVIVKLLVASFLMIAAPLGVYFGTASTIFAGSPTWAGGAAAITANVVLLGYIIVAVREDQGEDAPKVGKVE